MVHHLQGNYNMATSKTAKTTKPTSKNKEKLTVAQYINHQIEVSGRPQTEIAKEAGFEQNNMISMLKSGKTKLALKRIPALSKALGVDPRHLFMLAVSEYLPDAYDAMKTILNQPILTSNELEMLQIIRDASPNNPKIGSAQEEEALRSFVRNLESSKQAALVKAKADAEEAERERLRKEREAAELQAAKDAGIVVEE